MLNTRGDFERYAWLGETQVTRMGVFRALYLTRWAGRLPEGGVLTPAGLAAGACGHYSFFRCRILLHRHPGDRPVPEDMQAALRGQAPVPAWFTEGRGRTSKIPENVTCDPCRAAAAADHDFWAKAGESLIGHAQAGDIQADPAERSKLAEATHHHRALAARYRGQSPNPGSAGS